MSYILDALKRAESDRGRGSVPGVHTQQVMAGGASADTPGRPAWLWPVVVGSAVLVAGVGLYVYKPLSVRVNTGAVPPPPPAANTAGLPAPQITSLTAVPTGAADGTAGTGNEPAARGSARRAANTGSGGGNPPAVPSNEPRIYAVNDLPADVRNDLPKLTIGGSSYSSNPALRMLMINGKMYQEKDTAGPNLVLEQIRQGSAVMRFKGYRYRITY